MVKTMVATFQKTSPDGKGQEVIGHIVYSAGKLTFASDDVLALVSKYQSELKESDDEAIVEWMRKLPERFDGGYVRAGVVEA